MAHEEAVPLVEASFVTEEVRPCRNIRTEYVVIDEYFESHDNAREFSSESNIEYFESHENAREFSSESNHSFPPSPVVSAQNINTDQQCQREEDFIPSNAQDSTKVDQSKTFGAWAAGIVIGFLVGAGPSLSMAFGIGAAYYSQQEEGLAGDVARAFGDVALLSHEKFVQVNEKHNLMETLANSTVDFSRNCLRFAKRRLGSRNPTRQMSTEDTETT